MKHIFLFGLLAVLSAGTAMAHDPVKQRIEIEPDSSAPIEENDVNFKFQLVDNKTNSLVDERDLSITHEKKLHFLAYDPALREFQHVHPEFDGTFWQVSLHFNVSGEYWIWAQGELLDRTEFSTPTKIKVQVNKPAWPNPPTLKDIRAGASGNSTVTLSKERLKAGSMAMLNVILGRNDGSQPSITPYLGAFAHVIAVTDDADTLIHVHPMGGSRPNEGMLHATFPRKGFYRLWIQFIDAGLLRTIPLSVQVF